MESVFANLGLSGVEGEVNVPRRCRFDSIRLNPIRIV